MISDYCWMWEREGTRNSRKMRERKHFSSVFVCPLRNEEVLQSDGFDYLTRAS